MNDPRMNDSLGEPDPALEAMFRSAHAHFPDEPFVSATLNFVAADRGRSRTRRRVIQVAALMAVIAASPWLVAGSVLLSEILDQGFARASDWLATPAGMAIGAIAAAALAVLYRTRVRRASR